METMPARFVTWSCPVAGKNFVHNCKAAVEAGPVLACRGVALRQAKAGIGGNLDMTGPVLASRGVALRQAKAGISGNLDVTGPVLVCRGVALRQAKAGDWWELG